VKSLQCCHDKTISIDDLIAMGMFVLAITVERQSPSQNSQKKEPAEVPKIGDQHWHSIFCDDSTKELNSSLFNGVRDTVR
jgi:hypothetical protein